MNKFTLLIATCFLLLLSCKAKIEPCKDSCCHHDYDTTRIERSNDEIIRRYFSKYELTPKIVINNTEGNQTDIEIEGHKIRWPNVDDEKKIIIDGREIVLKDELTKNTVANLQKDTVASAENWSQVKLYKYAGKELIAIKMYYKYLEDNIAFLYLLYDTKTNKANYFGVHDPKLDMHLYDFRNKNISFVSESYCITPVNHQKVFRLYSLNNNGFFEQKNNPDGKPYEISQHYDDYCIKEFESLYTADWFEKINSY